jgi:hypothetical protein
MKTLKIFAAALAAGLLWGCNSDIRDEVRSALGPREAPRSQVFQADQKAAYEAVKAAVDEMSFTFVRGGPATGELEAMSGVASGDEPNSSRQILMKVHLSPAGDAGTEVQVSLIETLEADSSNQPGMATETPLRDTPLYSVFFRDVQKALDAPGKH